MNLWLDNSAECMVSKLDMSSILIVISYMLHGISYMKGIQKNSRVTNTSFLDRDLDQDTRIIFLDRYAMHLGKLVVLRYFWMLNKDHLQMGPVADGGSFSGMRDTDRAAIFITHAGVPLPEVLCRGDHSHFLGKGAVDLPSVRSLQWSWFPARKQYLTVTTCAW